MKRRMGIVLLAAMLALVLGSCGSNTPAQVDPVITPVEEETEQQPEQEPEKDPEPEQTPETEQAQEPEKEPEPEPETEPVPAGTNPLTGLPMEPEYEKNRPIAVMLNNVKKAQPQLGNSKADIIYEVPAEGGITRMLAVYQSVQDVGTLGSIRSTRPYYLELALGHDALLVHAGGSNAAYQNISNWGVNNMDGVRGGTDAQIFWRDQERRKNKGYEHSLMTSGENILGYLAKGRYRTEHKDGYIYSQHFTENGTPQSGTPAEHISLRFSDYKTGTFEYDAATGRYLVGQYGTAYIDGASGDQISTVNLLVLETSMSVLDNDGRLSVKTTGEGKGTYFCGGKSIPIQWKRSDRNSAFIYQTENGSPLMLGQGNSYVCIMNPKWSKLTVS